MSGAVSQEPDATGVAEITDNEVESRYEARAADGTLMGWLDYEHSKDNVLKTTHTVTLPAYRGKGVASQMAERVFADAEASGQIIDPACWYIAEFIQHHPKYSRQVVDLGF